MGSFKSRIEDLRGVISQLICPLTVLLAVPIFGLFDTAL